jgi:hypothetical protein
MGPQGKNGFNFFFAFYMYMIVLSNYLILKENYFFPFSIFRGKSSMISVTAS